MTSFSKPLIRPLLAGLLAAALLLASTAPAHAIINDGPRTAEEAAAASDGQLNCPQAAMFEFLRAMGEVSRGYDEAWPQVLATMDLSDISPDKAKNIAESLHKILDQLGEVRPEELPDATSVEKSGIRRFRYFPRPEAHGWVWKEAGPPAGRIEIERAGGAQGPWKFSSRTCREVEALAASLAKLPPRYVPSNNLLTESIEPTLQRTKLWDWIHLGAAAALGFALGKIAQMICRSLAKRSRSRNHHLSAAVSQNLATPLFLLLSNIGLATGASMIFLEQTLSFYVFSAIKLCFIVNAWVLLHNLINVLHMVLSRITARTESKLDDMLVPMIGKILRILLVAVFLLITAKTIFGLDITGWLAGFGIAGLAVSLAAQDSIKNLFGSITVFFDNPFAVGDRIIFGTYDCIIEEIGFRSTRVRTLEGNLVTIPNAKFIDGVVENISARTSMRRQLAVTLPQKTGAEKTQQAVDTILGVLRSPEVIESIDVGGLPPRAAATELAGDKLIIRVMYWYTLREGRDPWTFQAHSQMVNVRLVEALNKLGVEFTVS